MPISWKVWPSRLPASGRRMAATTAVGPSPLQDGAQVDGVVVGQAGVQRARGRQPHPVAGVAEVLGHRAR